MMIWFMVPSPLNHLIYQDLDDGSCGTEEQEQQHHQTGISLNAVPAFGRMNIP
jgi:hypothetical protein